MNAITDPRQLPDEVPLRGIDRFFLLLEGMMRRQGRPGQVCHLSLTLEGPLTADTLEDRLRRHPLSQWLGRLRLKTGWHPFQTPKWTTSGESTIPVHSHPCGEIDPPPPEYLRIQLDVQQEIPVRFDLIPSADGTRTLLLFHWHHALMDSTGALLYLRSLAGQFEKASPPILWQPPPADSRPWRKRMQDLQHCKARIYERSEGGFFHPTGSPGRTLSYHRLHFTPEETEQVDKQAVAAGASLQRSAYYLAATAAALRSVCEPSGSDLDFLTSLPQDQRRKGVMGPILANQVSFLFYRLPGNLLADRKNTVKEISRQMMEDLRVNFSKSYTRMMDLTLRFPSPLFRQLIRSPTKGKMASCWFSDTGTTLDSLQTFLELPVTGAEHFPPNMCPPGLTVISSRFNGRLMVTVAVFDGILPDDSLPRFLDGLRKELTA